MKLNISTILFIFTIQFCFSQTRVNNYTNIENFIFLKKIDSAAILIQKQKEIASSDYLNMLERFTKQSETYSDYYKLATKINERPTNDLSNLILLANTIPTPINKLEINLDYVYTNWLINTTLRDCAKLELATLLNNKTITYTKQFRSKDINVQKATLLLSNHKIVMLLIEGALKKGKALTLKCLEEAIKLKDNTLQIIFRNYLCKFLVKENDNDGFIKSCELSLALESETQKSPFYIKTLEKLANVLIYKGNNDARVKELLSIIYATPNKQNKTYPLYTFFLSKLDKTSPITKEIFNKFNVTTYIDFCSTIEKLGKNKLSQYKFNRLLKNSSNLLESKGFYKEAIIYLAKSSQLTRKIYSEDLANSLANSKNKLAITEKELELINQKEKNRLYIVMLLFGIFILVGLLIIIALKHKRERLLKEKNIEIKRKTEKLQKKEEEKSLLLSELNHRVKNNFQIVFSLLDMQTKGIKDKKTLEMMIDVKNRIKSMAIINQQLYKNNDNFINLDAYIKLLITELTNLYSNNKTVNTSLKSENVYFDVDTAVPLGLIINELATNAYKYAFKADRINKLTISIEKHQNDYYKLTVSDNGPGLDDAIDLKNIKSLGLKLVTRLVKQLQGTIHQNNDNGAYFEIQFKSSSSRKMLD